MFAYGQTGSGKTFTMIGPDAPSKGEPNALEGVIPRMCRDLFGRLAAMIGDSNGKITATVEATYIQIYMEKISDLWDRDGDGKADDLIGDLAAAAAVDESKESKEGSESTSGGSKAAKAGNVTAAKSSAAALRDENLGPQVRQRPNGEVYVDGVNRAVLKSWDTLASLLNEGNSRRTVGSTNMNATSSRSHAILTLYVTISDSDASDGDDSRRAKLHLVDLAGSERADATGATGDRLKEGAAINQSLSALGNVINALASAPAPGTKNATKPFVPYRDSVLTRVLQDSLGGNAFTLMLCCLSPASVNYSETLASLRFAARAKMIKTTVTKNVDPATAKINQLVRENKALRKLMQQLEEMAVAEGLAQQVAALEPAPTITAA
jgi:hypothetical protein